ncbi:MAG: RidA family protein [Betaproteobacteria bacterium]|nr:RidA family protein [Betaproteobacteria bacterium]
MNPPTLFAPGGFTNAVTVVGGKTIYVAGQVAFDPKGQIIGRGDLRAQFRQTYENVRAALAAAGATPADVVKLNTYVVNWDPAVHRAINRDERARFFTDRIHRPAPRWACRPWRSKDCWSRSRWSRW